jgi:D-aspartate ligase
MPTSYATEIQLHSRANAPNRSEHNPPAVVILNMFYSGLGIARDLAGKGIRVVGLSADPRIYGNFTRDCEVRSAPNSQDAPEHLLQALLRLAPEFAGAIIFPTRDADVMFLDRFREELVPYYKIAIPAHDCLMRVIDKHALAIASKAAKIPTPRTFLISSRSDLPRVEEEVGFPCVLKPTLAVTWRGTESWKKVGARKAVRADNPGQLAHEYETLSRVHHEVLAQEYISGSADQIVVLGGYVRRGGELSHYFTARKLLQSPADFGTGCIVQSEEIQEIVSLSRRLCHALEYEGLAEIEYKYDEASGSFRLIEINTRHWDWHGLGSASGVNLSWVAYCDMTGRSVDPPPERIAPAKWIAEDALFIYALRALYRRQLRLAELWRQLSGRRVYGIFSWDDPLPGLRYCFQFVAQLIKSIFDSLRRGRVS